MVSFKSVLCNLHYDEHLFDILLKEITFDVGIAVVTVMLITTLMVTLIMLVVWKTSIWLIALFFAVYVVVEGVYLSSVLYKFKQGGYLPLAFALVLMIIMGIWHYVHRQIYVYELNNKVSSEYIRDLVLDPKVNRVPGMGLIYSELVQGIPPIFPHFLANIPSLHSVVVFISIKSFPVGKVALDERFLFRYVEPKEYRMFRCVVRYGYNDIIEEAAEFEAQLIDHLNEFIRLEQYFLEAGNPEAVSEPLTNPQHSTLLVNNEGRAKGSTVHIEESLQQAAASTLSFSSGSTKSFNAVNSVNSSNRISGPPLQGAEAEMQYVQRAKENGVVYLLGGTEVTAKQNSSFIKRMVVNYLYDFIRKNFRGNEKMLEIPNSRLVKVGMTYEI